MFYKYRTDSHYTETIFTTGKVHLSTASALNDPFECSLQEIGKDWINSQITEMKSAAVLGFIMTAKKSIKDKTSFFGLTGKEIKVILVDLSRKKDLESKYSYFRKTMHKFNGHPPSDCDNFFSNIDNQLNNVGIFSMSTCPLIQLLWAHYTQDHKGICIGFDPTKEGKLSNSEHCLQVTYSNSIPKMSSNGFKSQMDFSFSSLGKLHVSSFHVAFSDKTFQSAISTKPKCWEYEKEWRYVEPFGGEYEWPGKLSEIVFGLKCPEERRKHYINLAERNVPNEVYLYEIVIKNGTNEIERIPYKIKKTIPLMKNTKTKQNDENDNEKKILSPEQFSYEMYELIKKGNINEALSEININLEQFPNNPNLLNMKAIALGFEGQHEDALSIFQKLDEEYPNMPDNLYQQSCALHALNRDEEAINLLKKAHELDHNNPSVPFNLGVMIIQNDGDEKEAKLFLKTAKLMGHPNAEMIINELNHN